jgi:hypothetical protein
MRGRLDSPFRVFTRSLAIPALAALAVTAALSRPASAQPSPGMILGDEPFNIQTTSTPADFDPINSFGPDGMDPREANLSGMMADPYGVARVQGPPAPGLNYSAAWGQGGNLSVYGNPNPGAYGAGFNLSGWGGSRNGGSQGGGPNGRDPVWSDVRDFQVGTYSSESQTVVSGGGTLAFTYEDEHAVALRGLLGGAFGGLTEDTVHFSGDLFAATQTEFLGDHWFKAGLLYDVQDQFGKVGPEFGLLLFADSRRPVSVDVAYGIGQGAPLISSNATLTAVADDDVQVRVGTFFGPHIQLGVTGTWYSWDDEQMEDVNGWGGFATLNLDYLQMTFDVTTDDLGTRGFANVALTTGAWSIRNRNRDRRDGPVVHPRDWLTRPVIRDTGLRLQSRQLTVAEALAAGVPTTSALPNGPPGVGNITNINVFVYLPQFLPAGGETTLAPLGRTFDLNNNATVDAGDILQVNVELVNNSSQVATNVSIGTTLSTTGAGQPLTAVFPGAAVSGGNFPNIQPGLSGGVTAGGAADIRDIDIIVNAGAAAGQQIFIQFDVSADGQTRRFQAGPIIVGQPIQTSPTASIPAVPL